MSSGGDQQRRNSRALIPPLITNELERAKAEARNGLLQYDEGIKAAAGALEKKKRGERWLLKPSLILSLQRLALQNISTFAGTYRPDKVEIDLSVHVPPDAAQVPELVEDLCDFVNDNWDSKTAISLSAYILWRLNWIHPFDDGNGRTSRIVSYIVMLVKSENYLGGSPTIPDLLVSHRADYNAALDAADASLKQRGAPDLRDMEGLLSSLLAKQLTSIYKAAGGTITEDVPTV